jgi:hypothetical protein
MLRLIATDLPQVLRGLRKSPVFTGAVVLSLGLALGAATLTYGLAWGTHRPLQFAGEERLARILSVIITPGASPCLTCKICVPATGASPPLASITGRPSV